MGKYIHTFKDEEREAREKEAYYENKRKEKQRAQSKVRYQKKKNDEAVQSMSEKIRTMVGWICFSKKAGTFSDNSHIKKANTLAWKVTQRSGLGRKVVVDYLYNKACEKARYIGGAERQWDYVGSILHKELLPELADYMGVNLDER